MYLPTKSFIKGFKTQLLFKKVKFTEENRKKDCYIGKRIDKGSIFIPAFYVLLGRKVFSSHDPIKGGSVVRFEKKRR